MKCTYCNQEISGTTVLDNGGQPFCNSLHRVMWTRGQQAGSAPGGGGMKTASNAAPPGKTASPIVRRVLFGLLYTVVVYFLGLAVTGGLIGGIAGFRAGKMGQDPGEAGRAAGTQFGQDWSWLVLLVSIGIVTFLVVKGWLPGTKKAEPV